MTQLTHELLHKPTRLVGFPSEKLRIAAKTKVHVGNPFSGLWELFWAMAFESRIAFWKMLAKWSKRKTVNMVVRKNDRVIFRLVSTFCSFFHGQQC